MSRTNRNLPSRRCVTAWICRTWLNQSATHFTRTFVIGTCILLQGMTRMLKRIVDRPWRHGAYRFHDQPTLSLGMTHDADVTGVSIINEGRLGTLAEQVIDQVQCSVLTIKPNGFVSPVTLPEV